MLGDRATAAAGTGLVARFGANDGAAVGVRSELDALLVDVDDDGGEAPRHVCGHDVHSAALVALARAAEELESELPAPLLAIFQPSEEAYPSGAELLVRERVVGPGTSAVVAVHLHPDIEWGQAALDAGPVNASSDNLDIEIEGRTTHAAYPHRGADAVLALSQVVVSLHAAVSRRFDPTAGIVLNVGVVRGGTAENVVAGRARAQLTIRAQRPEDRETLRELIAQVAEATAAAHGCCAKVELKRGEPALVNDPGIVAPARRLLDLAALLPAPPWSSCGSDDFAFFSEAAPIVMAFAGLRGAPGYISRPLHHPGFAPPDEAIRAVARLQATLYTAAAYRDRGSIP